VRLQLPWNFPRRRSGQNKMGGAIGRWYRSYFRLDCTTSRLKHTAFLRAVLKIDHAMETSFCRVHWKGKAIPSSNCFVPSPVA
jgi:hypothetical protein